MTRDDLLRLLEIKMARILKFNKAKADELIARIKAELEQIDYNLAHMTEVTIEWFETIKARYADEHPRAPRFALSTRSRRPKWWRRTRNSM